MKTWFVSLLVYCPAACQANAGVFNLADTLNLLLGLQWRRAPHITVVSGG